MARKAADGISDHAKAGKHRREDARKLLDAGRWRGAMYLAGYSVECLLKTKLMRMYDCHHLRELEDELQRRGAISATATIYTHGLEVLLRLTGGLDRLRQNQQQWREFNIVNRWIPAWRYSSDLSRREDAEDFLEAIDIVSHWIETSI